MGKALFVARRGGADLGQGSCSDAAQLRQDSTQFHGAQQDHDLGGFVTKKKKKSLEHANTTNKSSEIVQLYYMVSISHVYLRFMTR